MKTKLFIFYTLLSLSWLAGCRMDFVNPSAASSDQIFTNDNALTGVAIGLQRAYTLDRGVLYNSIAMNGFATNELSLRNSGNLNENNLSLGGKDVDANNGIVGGLWITTNKIVYDADNVIKASQRLTDKGYASGLVGYTSIFKALSLGTLSQYWEKIPDGIGNNVTFIKREDGYTRAIQVLNDALTGIQANPISTNLSSRLPAGIDIPNTLNALKARYLVALGRYPEALAAANLVNLTVRSEFRFDAQSPNPISFIATATNNVFQVVDSTLGLPVGLQPAVSDRRVPFYTSINTTILPRFRIAGFGATNLTRIPVYLPGEMQLIKAECHARANSLTAATTELNGVLNKLPSADAFGLGAGLPAYSGPQTQEAILTEIYRNRCIELYMSGLKLEDMRRFGRPAATTTPGYERNRNFFPYPFQESNNNPNTPANPAI